MNIHRSKQFFDDFTAATNVSPSISIGGKNLRITRQIAEGGYSLVFLAEDDKGRSFALKKMIVHDRETLRNVQMEIKIMKKLHPHPHVISFYGTHSQKSNGVQEVYVLMEMARDTLTSVIQRISPRSLPERRLLSVFHDVCHAVAHMHAQQPPIIHRDLKLENVLLGSDNRWKLCDYGSATTIVYDTASMSARERSAAEDDITQNTTAGYRSPEMVDLYRLQRIDERADIWALGCLLFKAAFQFSPFEDDSPLAILNGRYRIPHSHSYSSDLVSLIRTLLVSNPDDRPDIFEVLEQVSSLLNVKNPYPRPSHYRRPHKSSTSGATPKKKKKKKAKKSSKKSKDVNVENNNTSNNNATTPSVDNNPLFSMLDWHESTPSNNTGDSGKNKNSDNDASQNRQHSSSSTPSESNDWAFFSDNDPFAEPSIPAPPSPQGTDKASSSSDAAWMDPPSSSGSSASGTALLGSPSVSQTPNTKTKRRGGTSSSSRKKNKAKSRSKTKDKSKPTPRRQPKEESASEQTSSSLLEALDWSSPDGATNGRQNMIDNDINDADDSNNNISGAFSNMSLLSGQNISSSRSQGVDMGSNNSKDDLWNRFDTYNDSSVNNINNDSGDQFSDDVTTTFFGQDDGLVSGAFSSGRNFAHNTTHQGTSQHKHGKHIAPDRVQELLGRALVPFVDKRQVWTLKATSRTVSAPKPKYVRRLVLDLWENKKPAALLLHIRHRPIFSSVVVGYKVLVLLHYLVQEGPPQCLMSLAQATSLVRDISDTWENEEQFHPLLTDYASYLQQRLRLHRRHRVFEGNFSIDPVLEELTTQYALRSAMGDDPFSPGAMTAMLDLWETALGLEGQVFGQLGSACHSSFAIPLVNDLQDIYAVTTYCLTLMAKHQSSSSSSSSSSELKTLTQRYYQLYPKFATFLDRVRETEALTTLITVIELDPDGPPNFDKDGNISIKPPSTNVPPRHFSEVKKEIEGMQERQMEDKDEYADYDSSDSDLDEGDSSDLGTYALEQEIEDVDDEHSVSSSPGMVTLDKCLKMKGNNACADCKSKGPRWASINLGVFICQQCSGIHRGLGVHISKVRSVTLDKWSQEQIRFMYSMGNAKANRLYEHRLPSSFDRPNPNTDNAAMERFIRDKYEHKKYMKRSSKAHTQAKRKKKNSNPSRQKKPSSPAPKPRTRANEGASTAARPLLGGDDGGDDPFMSIASSNPPTLNESNNQRSKPQAQPQQSQSSLFDDDTWEVFEDDFGADF